MKINASKIKYLSKITNSLYDELKIEFLYHSNHLEGSTFTKTELDRLLYERKVEGNHSIDDVIETKNSLELFDQVIEECDEPLGRLMLFRWHRTLKKGTIDDEIHNIGHWKNYENRLRGVDLKLAYPHEVNSLMYNLIATWNELKEPTLKDIADFHYHFELIHPFQDGNGRIGRFVILKQCIESNIDLIAIDAEYDEEYRNALYIAQKTGNSDELVNVFSKCQQKLDQKLSPYTDILEQINTNLKLPEKTLKKRWIGRKN